MAFDNMMGVPPLLCSAIMNIAICLIILMLAPTVTILGYEVSGRRQRNR
ncbi:hypothetical protein [Microvirga makkahensis]|nr:hypothetical protein [Microvirga makkahensis]